MERTFQPTPPSREATGNEIEGYEDLFNFNPHLPRGRRRKPDGRRSRTFTGFQPTPPSREATRILDSSIGNKRFQPTPPSREATRIDSCVYGVLIISTHTSLAGGDKSVNSSMYCLITISTHTSLAGGDDGNPKQYQKQTISTHTSLAGGDKRSFAFASNQRRFQPTPPSREATAGCIRIKSVFNISTHTSLAGGDKRSFAFASNQRRFQPTPPSREATQARKGKHESI